MEGAEEPLDPPFGLRRRGGDPSDAEFEEGATDLGRGHGALQLLRQAVRRAGVAMKNAMTVGVSGARDAVATDELAEHEEVAVGIFLGPKDTGHERAGGIINGALEDEPGAAILEPAVATPVHQDEEAGLRHALAAPAMLGRASRARAGEPRLPEDALDGGPGEHQALLFAEQLRQMMIIDTGVAGAGQVDDPRPDGLEETLRGGAAAVAMGERREAMLADLGDQATDMADRKAQHLGGIRAHQPPLKHLDENVAPLLFSRAQCDRPPVHTGRVTESLSC